MKITSNLNRPISSCTIKAMKYFEKFFRGTLPAVILAILVYSFAYVFSTDKQKAMEFANTMLIIMALTKAYETDYRMDKLENAINQRNP